MAPPKGAYLFYREVGFIRSTTGQAASLKEPSFRPAGYD